MPSRVADDEAKLRIPQGAPDKVLHRVALNNVGKPIWRYSDLKQFAGALGMIIHTHYVLSEHGVLHSDISAGNMFIRVRATMSRSGNLIIDELDVPEGFLSDFELAKITPQGTLGGDNTSSGTTTDQRVLTPTSEKTPGDAISGTVIFMSTRLLSAIADQFSKLNVRATSNLTSVSQLRKEFADIFSAASVKTLHAQRIALLGREDYAPIAMLQAYADDYLKSRPLATFLTMVWTALKRCPKTEPSVSKPASQDLPEAQWLAATNKVNLRLGLRQFTQRSVPAPSEEVQERWSKLRHAEWLGLLDMMIENLEKDKQN
ncbi:hypothetical protein ACG7TL_001691 [Trametes sanguinea]